MGVSQCVEGARAATEALGQHRDYLYSHKGCLGFRVKGFELRV